MTINNTVGVVVLNYINYKDTIRCVNSFLKQRNVKLKILIIDNGSPNDSYEKLRKYFAGFNSIKTIRLNKNIGYARGNNIGIRYFSKEKIYFILVVNSDTTILDNNTAYNMVKMYRKNVALISPNIKNKDGSDDLYVVYKKRFLKIRLIKACLQTIFWKVHLPLKEKEKVVNNTNQNNNNEDCVGITGSFYLLTPTFFRYYNGLYEGTFLYGEENALIELLRRKKLSTLKCTNGLVLHKGAGSSGTVNSIPNKKKRLMARSSVKVLLLIVFGRAVM